MERENRLLPVCFIYYLVSFMSLWMPVCDKGDEILHVGITCSCEQPMRVLGTELFFNCLEC